MAAGGARLRQPQPARLLQFLPRAVSGYALKQSIGTGKGTCSLDDFEKADLIIVIGQNPASNHPRMMVALHEAKKRGATVLAINPLRERGFANFSDPKNIGELLRDKGIAVADEIYQVRIGGDFALLKGVMKALLESERATPGMVFDHEFIERHTEGFDALIADLDACDLDDLDCPLGPGRSADARYRRAVTPPRRRGDADLVHGPDPPPAGRGNHPAGGQSRAAARQYRPRRRRRDAGARPLQCAGRPDHGRDLHRVGAPGWTTSKPRSAACRCAATAAAMPPAYLEGLFDGQVQALLSLGGNFGAAAPDAPRVQQALERCRFTLHIATKLNRTHCHPGEVGLLLPTLGRTDKDLRGGREQTHLHRGFVEHRARLARHPTADQRAAAQRAGDRRRARATRSAARRRCPGASSPTTMPRCASASSNASAASRPASRTSTPGSEPTAASSCPTSPPSGAGRPPAARRSSSAHALRDDEPVALARQRHGDEALTLMTIRAHDQFNTTVYSQDDRYRDVDRRPARGLPQCQRPGGARTCATATASTSRPWSTTA